MSDLDRFVYDWNRHERACSYRTEVDDETLRDGLQSPSVQAPDLDTRKRCLQYMAALGIHRVNVGLPMSSQLPQIREMLRYIDAEGLPMRPGLAVRTVIDDIEEVVHLQDEFPRLRLRANAVLGASRIRLWAEGWSHARVEDMAVQAIAWAVDHGLQVMFVTEDTTRTHPEDVRRIYTAAIQAGVSDLCMADTVGHATPAGAAALVTFVRGIVRDAAPDREVKLNWHGHSDRGLALANSLAAVEAGVDVVHGTILGIGERCGNTALDQLLVNLKLLGAWDPPLTCLAEYVQTISDATGVVVPPGHPAFGRDAFRTATGVHAAAIIKARQRGSAELMDLVYSSVPASLVGREQMIEIGPLSGKWCVVSWLQTHGRPIDDEPAIERVLAAARASSRVLTDDEIERALQG